MKLRILSGIVIGLLFVTSIIWVKQLFYPVILLVAILMLLEWYMMTKSSSLFLLAGLPIISIPIISLLLVGFIDQNRFILLTYFIIIWSVDTFAMLGGKTIRGPKLAPYISPNKTWSGLLTGIISASLISLLFCISLNFSIYNYYFSNKIHIILTSMLIALISQLSDLFVSCFKRKFKVKDTGHIIPGHGGILDRFDSIILTAPLLLIIVYIGGI